MRVRERIPGAPVAFQEEALSTGKARGTPGPCHHSQTMEVRNRFKGLDLIDRVPDELWTEVHDIVQKTGIKTIPMEKK